MLKNNNKPEGKPALSQAGQARRRLGRAGAAGVLMTLSTQNAMAEMLCHSPSAGVSNNPNVSNAPHVVCTGRSPGYWHHWLSEWSAAGVAPDQLFSTVFDVGALPGYSSVTCRAILNHQDFDINNLGQQIMAVYLNAASGRINFLTTEDLTTMWREVTRNGEYVPAAGQEAWTREQLKEYLEKTHDGAVDPSWETETPEDEGTTGGKGGGKGGGKDGK